MRRAARTALRGMRRLRSRWLDGAAILLYHRVGPGGHDPFRLSVAPERFAEHMGALRRAARPVPLVRLVEAAGRNALAPGSVAVTFDDGYSDTLHTALPVLENTDVPATVFALASGAGEEFWWDRLARLLGEGRPASSANRMGRAPGTGALPTRGARSLHRSLAPMTPEERSALLEALEADAPPASISQPVYRSLTAAELSVLAASPLIEIGAHTYTHPPLDAVSGERLRREVADGRAALEATLGSPVRSFAYPHGAVSGRVERAVRDAGYALACGTRPDVVWRRSDPFRLPRLWVHDEDGDALLRRLRGWGVVA